MCSLHVLNKRPTPCFLSLACPRNPIPVKTRPVPLPVLRPPRLCLSLCQFSLSLAKRRLRKSWTCWLPGYLGNQALMSLKPCKSTWALHWGCFSLACVRRNSGTVYYNIPFFPLCDLGDWFLSLSLSLSVSFTHTTHLHYIWAICGAKVFNLSRLILLSLLWMNLSLSNTITEIFICFKGCFFF